jgi:hypothetical protein
MSDQRRFTQRHKEAMLSAECMPRWSVGRVRRDGQIFL